MESLVLVDYEQKNVHCGVNLSLDGAIEWALAAQ